jgi:catechol 2,3-dioxygenase-like lactoylglutathione lyase family enzyme
MASRVKHIALSSEDPAKTAAFYKEVFGMTELHRKPGDTGDEGVWLTDGYIYFAILKFKSHEAPDMGEGPSTVPGVHHIGFYVDDLEDACKTIESASATECPESSQANRKYKGPEGLMIDLRARGWDEQIQAKTQLFALTPAKTEA